MKHIDIQLHFVRDVIELVYTPTENMLADFLTKSISRPAINGAMKQLRLLQMEDKGGVEIHDLSQSEHDLLNEKREYCDQFLVLNKIIVRKTLTQEISVCFTTDLLIDKHLSYLQFYISVLYSVSYCVRSCVLCGDRLVKHISAVVHS
ncbi:hypothetical protein O181_131268 [Austropuccinia psidii MF-1]|uniref:Uncharacterized protein n=1 Tax=Austropuccinia psidii MF-1 TaxID=1389203 RepID=A0A9Q3L056_9BASI|nr:hypothetical protein [Austropuccinia psidii MF-1]